MTRSQKARRTIRFGGIRVAAGETCDIRLPVSQTYTGEEVHLPMRVTRAKKAGPVVLLTAAVHGDEVNGVGIIRQCMRDFAGSLLRGALVCVPVVNVFGFETHDRYLPDRRDLNRSFPGSDTGSLASRFAETIMTQLIERSDYCIDLHSASDGRTNYPNVRGDLRGGGVRELAEAFGCELIVNGRGPEGSLRRAACEAGCPTIILEAGEVGKIEPAVLDIGLQGVRNALIHLGMLAGTPSRPIYQTTVFKTTWVRAELGGLLRFHVVPGDLVQRGQPLATNESVFGEARTIIIAPADGVVLGMTTHPAVKPGEPVCHIALPGRKISAIRRALAGASDESPEARVRDSLASSFAVTRKVRRPRGE